MELWKGCAGPLVDVPRAREEKVYYFPQGHMEQLEASTNQELSERIPMFNLPSKILCSILDIQLLGLKLKLCTTDRVGLLSDVTRIFCENSLTVTWAEVSTRDGKAVILSMSVMLLDIQ